MQGRARVVSTGVVLEGLASPIVHTLPVLVAEAGEPTAKCFLEFITAHLRNPNTWAAYERAAGEFLA